MIKKLVRNLLARNGYRLEKLPPDLESEFLAFHEQVQPFTMTSRERQHALYKAVRYITDAGIEGDIVECGVWKGGSSMLAALTLKEHDDLSRTLYLYDTFAGMSEPTTEDINLHGNSAHGKWRSLMRGGANDWDYAPLEEVEANVASVDYPSDKLVFVKGKVEDTIPHTVPGKIALLRLDTDWYASTRHELEHLFPRLVPGGVLIIDDYGHWQGARQAVDEYFASQRIPFLLNRIDYTGRIGVKANVS